MKMIIFAKRNIKEILRDPVSLIFMLGLPLFLLFIFQQFKIPNDIYNINNFAPAIIIFSFSFLTLFGSQLISKDRASSFLTRLFASPMKPIDYIIGYSLCMLPIAIFQSILFFIFALLFKLELSINILYTILLMIPVSFLYTGLGILIGCITSDKSAPGVSSIIVQLVCFTSGMWFDTSMVGKIFGFICKILPFKYTMDTARNALNGNFNEVWGALLITIISTIVVYIISTILFKNKMNNDKM